MKKNILSLLFMFLLLGVISSCSLTEDPIDQLPENEAYKSPKLIYLNTVAFLYPEIGGKDGGNGLAGADRGLYDLNEAVSDEFILPTRGGDWLDGYLWQDLFRHQWTATNDIVKATWDYLYRVVGKTNQSLDILFDLQKKDPTNEYYSVYIAEVRAIRAMFYYYLLDTYGRVPLVISSKTAIADISQSNRSEVYAFIIKELEEAIPFLKEERSNFLGEYYGRMTRPVAYFLMAKLALNAEVYTDNEWWNSKSPKGTAPKFTVNGKEMNNWEATQAYCDLITAMGYELEENFSFNFSVKNETSKENIFVIPMDPETYEANNLYLIRSRHYAHAKAYNQDGWNGASATLEAYKAFKKDNDPRLEKSFFTGEVFGPDGKQVMIDDENPLIYRPEAIALIVSDTEFEKTAGARWKKYEFDETALGGGKLVRNDFVLFRYADVLLMKAEAKIRNKQDGSTEFNLVRNRVGAVAKPATLENILEERLLELSWEGMRRQDLIRFGKFNDALTDRSESKAFRKVFPIPGTVLDLNKKLSQNNGY